MNFNCGYRQESNLIFYSNEYIHFKDLGSDSSERGTTPRCNEPEYSGCRLNVDGTP